VLFGQERGSDYKIAPYAETLSGKIARSLDFSLWRAAYGFIGALICCGRKRIERGIDIAIWLVIVRGDNKLTAMLAADYQMARELELTYA
jgi:hypothetical protein